MNLDLDLENYSLSDLFNLFNITELNVDSLKTCYKKAVMTHPDKSGLDKSIFIFYTKAFKLLKSAFMYRIEQRQNASCTKTTQYNPKDDVQNDTMEEMIKKKASMDKKSFHVWFNKAFDNLPSYDDEMNSGYDHWFKSSKHSEHENCKNLKDMHTRIHAIKSEGRDMVVYDTPMTVGWGGYSIVREKIDDYSSDVFSKLQYNDLKKSHVETVIPVTEKDMRKQQFNTMNDLDTFRQQDMQQTVYNTNDPNVNRDRETTVMGYKLARQMEHTAKINDVWRSSVHRLEY